LSYVFVEAFPPTDREGEENYVCDVTDNHGHHVTKDYRVTTYRSVYIIEAESGARWINETTLELKCAIWSPRRPRVLLGLTIHSSHGEFSPDQLVAQGDNRYVASAAIHSDTLDRLDPHQMYLLNTYVTTGGTCSATTQIYDGGNHWVDAAHLYNNMLVPDRPNMER
ncbi:uncharacterized protein LOC101848450, partial [Aplysia californica]|uniref:Uncharacterized protein LOC101848450 n=1 Tax=Aplysia californica TaxID=6500 RepID=A0ABM0JY33_APLCA